MITEKEAKERGCRRSRAHPITVVQWRARAKAAPRAGRRPAPGETSKVDPDQRARDSDARRILESRTQARRGALAAMRKEFNNGEPERRGDERNYQKLPRPRPR
jgi:hypothetical protein